MGPVPCDEILAALSEYLDGELDEQLCAEIERHMAACGNCRIMVDTLRKTILLYRTYGHEELPEGARERLYAILPLKRAA
jgi:anti-sigma factor (TIGR02949 family)